MISRAFLKAISRLLIGVVLFAQFAVASYACPGLMGVRDVTGMHSMANDASQGLLTGLAADDAAVPAESAGMPPGCEQMDPDAANLCAEHCHPRQQSADRAAVPVVSMGIPTLLYSLPLEAQRSLACGRAFPAVDADLDAAPEPPHAILHCVFRL
ncbi:hypothetical protein BH11PSE10_BH11PSE10_10880 [soil metagenome]